MTDEGYFPRGTSVLRRVHEERAVGLLYGQRALGIGALAPLNFIGTQRHDRSYDRPFQRLARTAEMFETIFFGTRAQAGRVLDLVHRMHENVKGELPEAAGPFPAGTPYSALDPELMLWTIAPMADSAQVFYELFVRRLSDEEREGLWRDYVRFGELFGMPREVAPPSHAAFREYWHERLSSPESFLTGDARRIGRAVMFEIPVPLTRAPAMKVHNLVMLGSLPSRVREHYDLQWTPAHAIAFRAAVAALRAPRPITPRSMRTGANAEAFKMVAETERARIDAGPAPRYA